jgi:hypothetical protein
VFPHQGQSELSTNTSSRKDNPTFGRLMKRSGVVFNLIPFTVTIPPAERDEKPPRPVAQHADEQEADCNHAATCSDSPLTASQVLAAGRGALKLLRRFRMSRSSRPSRPFRT